MSPTGSEAGSRLQGVSHDEHAAVEGVNDFAPSSPPGAGGNGGWFESAQGEGVRGWAKSPAHGGVVGVNTAGGIAVYGTSDDGGGVVGESKNGEGVRGVSHNKDHGGVVGVCDNPAGGTGVYGKCNSGLAGWFDGKTNVSGVLTALDDLHVTGNVFLEKDLHVTGNVFLEGADLAEQFVVVGDRLAGPGSVVVLAGDDSVRVSDEAYDHRVAGVVSGARGYRPAVILDQRPGVDRYPLALTGKAWCNVDADICPIHVGDLLTTSSTPGHAMRAIDAGRAFGAVVGKSLGNLESGRGVLLILVALQ